MKKNNLILMIVTISIFVVLLIGATYAYFASNTNTGNGLDFSATLDDNNIAFTATSGTLSLHVAAENMLQSQVGQGDAIAAESVGEENITITLSSNTEAPIACTYNVYFQWNTNEAYLTPTNANKNEFTLELDLQDSDGTGSEGTNKFANETQLTRVITTTNKTLVVENAYIVGNSVNSGSQTWVPTAKFYNLTDNQSALAGATFGGKFTIEDVECNVKAEPTLSETLIGLISDNEYTSSQDNTKYVVRHEEVTHNGITYDAGVRYEGNDPDNYVTFNGNEEWRIIGVFEGSTIGLEPGKQYTKIIRNTPMYKGWDDNENDWSNSTLYSYLNGEYLQSLTDTNKIAQYNGNYNTWYLRGMYDETHMGEEAYTPDWYLAERITGSPAPNADATTTGAIGIMYPSDYGYAAYGSSCDNKTSMTLYNYAGGCAEVDWLLLEETEEWLISPSPDKSYHAFNVNAVKGGSVYYDCSVSNELAVHPVLYLGASVKIAAGAGTKANPYKLG